MMRGIGNMQGMMKQVQKIQGEMAEAQELLNKTEFTGKATNELVKAVFIGDRRMKNIQINEEVVDLDDIEMLRDLVAMAVNDTIAQIDVEAEKKLEKYVKGLPGF